MTHPLNPTKTVPPEPRQTQNAQETTGEEIPSGTNPARAATGGHVPSSAKHNAINHTGTARGVTPPSYHLESDSDHVDPGLPEMNLVNQNRGEPEQSDPGVRGDRPQIRGPGSDRVLTPLPMRRLGLGQVLWKQVEQKTSCPGRPPNRQPYIGYGADDQQQSRRSLGRSNLLLVRHSPHW